MIYTDADVFMYQILDCLVSKYNYKIVNVPRSKADIWLANSENENYPMIRLNTSVAASAIFEKDYLTKVKRALAMVIKQTHAPLLIINTNYESKDFKEEDIAQIIVHDQELENNQLQGIFPELTSAIKKVSDHQDECAKLMRHMETVQMQQIKEARKFKFSSAPKATMGIIILNVILFALYTLFLVANNNVASLVFAGGYYKALVVYMGEYWRILTTGFIHLNGFLLIYYILVLYQIGTVSEKIYKPLNIIIIFFSSLFVGNIFPLIFDGNILSFGMGAGVFGIMASIVVHLWESKLYRNKMARIQLLNVLIFPLMILFIGDISGYALLGGFLTGGFLAIILYPSERLKRYRSHFGISFLMILAILVYAGYQVGSAYPQYKELDKEIVKEYKNKGFSEYADKIENTLKQVYEEE